MKGRTLEKLFEKCIIQDVFQLVLNMDKRTILFLESLSRLKRHVGFVYIPFRYISTSDGTNLQLQHQLLSSFITFKNSDPEGKIKVIRDLEDFKSENIGLGFQIVLVR